MTARPAWTERIGVQDLVLARALDEVAARSGAECLDDGVVVLEHGHDDDADVWAAAVQAAVASMPVMPGIARSISATSGSELEHGLTPVAPSPATPQTSMSSIEAKRSLHAPGGRRRCRR